MTNNVSYIIKVFTKNFCFLLRSLLICCLFSLNLYAEVLNNNNEQTDLCTYTPFPEIQDWYGEFSYRILTSYINDSDVAIGHLLIHPSQNKFLKGGTFKVLIDSLPVEIFQHPTLSDQGRYVIPYSTGDGDINIRFKTTFVNTDAEIKLLHQTEDSDTPFEIIFTIVSYCPPCEDAFSITPLLWAESKKRSIRSVRPTNTGVVIEIPSQGAFDGAVNSGPRQIKVKGPKRCGQWLVESFASWINITHPTIGQDGKVYGFGDDVVEYTVLKNDDEKERSSVITFKTQADKLIASFPVVQKDRRLSKIWINELDPESPLFNEAKYYTQINENNSVQLTLAAKWADESVTTINAVDKNIVWNIDSLQYAEIYPSGVLKANYIRGEPKDIMVFASYAYQSGLMLSTRRTQNALQIIDNSQVQYIEINGPEAIDEGDTGDYKVIASLSNENDTNITSEISWSVSPPQYASVAAVKRKYNINNELEYVAELKTNNVVENTTIKLTASYSNKGIIINETTDITIQDNTVLERIIINGAGNITNDESFSYIVRAYWSNEPSSILSKDVMWLLDLSDYQYASISSNGVLSPKMDMIGNTTKTINVSAMYDYDGETLNQNSKKAFKSVSLNGSTNWELSISLPYTSLTEGETIQLEANIRVDNGFPQDITKDATWSIEPEESEIASIFKGNLSIGNIQTSSEAFFVKACYTYSDKMQCDIKKITVYDTTELTKLSISGETEIVEGNIGTYKATTSWTNIPDQDATNKVHWSVHPSDNATITSQGRILALPVDQNTDIQLTASYSYNSNRVSDTKTITIVPGIKYLEIAGEQSMVNDNETAQYQAIVYWKDGGSANVTNQCEWAVDGPADIGKVDNGNPGQLMPHDIDGDQIVKISATYSFGEDNLLSKKNHRQVIVKDAFPRMLTIDGQVFSNGLQTGVLMIDTYAVSDTAYSDSLAHFETDWPIHTETKAYQLSIPASKTCNLIAYIDMNFNNQLDECESWSVYENAKPEELSQSVILTLQNNSLCSTAGVALDLSLATQEYIDSFSYQDIETHAVRSAEQELSVGIVAINTLNLDTFQVELQYDPLLIKYIKGSETEGGFLEQNYGNTIGFSVVEKQAGVLNIAASLVGSDQNQAPDGSGLLATMTFKILSTASGSNIKNVMIYLSNVYYINSQGETEKIVNLSHASIDIKQKPCEQYPWDFNKDGIVDFRDLNPFGDHWLFTEDDPKWDEQYNLNSAPDIDSNKQIINYKDLIALSIHWLETTSCNEN
jgi:hypothetical protein